MAASVLAADAPVKALVGGRLIDGFGGPPIANTDSSGRRGDFD
jgi:hypothetical protein